MALALFARHGYAAVSMRQIASEVGVRAGAIYQYTEDKQSLLFGLMDEHMDALLAAWEAVPENPELMDRLRDFCEFHIGYHLDRPEAVFISYMELRNLTPENFEIIEAKRRRYEGCLKEILAAGVEQGDFNLSDIHVTTMAIIAMLTGINTWFREDGRLNRRRVERIYWRLVRRMVSGG